jgi:hypothetical protein
MHSTYIRHAILYGLIELRTATKVKTIFLGSSLRHINTVYSLFPPTVGVELSGLATPAVGLFTARNTA